MYNFVFSYKRNEITAEPSHRNFETCNRQLMTKSRSVNILLSIGIFSGKIYIWALSVLYMDCAFVYYIHLKLLQFLVGIFEVICFQAHSKG